MTHSILIFNVFIQCSVCLFLQSLLLAFEFALTTFSIKKFLMHPWKVTVHFLNRRPLMSPLHLCSPQIPILEFQFCQFIGYFSKNSLRTAVGWDFGTWMILKCISGTHSLILSFFLLCSMLTMTIVSLMKAACCFSICSFISVLLRSLGKSDWIMIV